MKLGMITISLLVTPVAMAQMSAKDGFGRMQSNIDNSKANLEDYRKNLTVVNTNLNSVLNVKSQIEQQKKDVKTAITDNTKSMNAIDGQEKEIKKMITDEDKMIQKEQLQVAELEKQIAALKANQQKRQGNITQYQTQLQIVAQEKASFKSRSEELARIQGLVQERSKEVAALESQQRGKKKGYEGEIAKWEKESDRHVKLLDEMKGLSETVGK